MPRLGDQIGEGDVWAEAVAKVGRMTRLYACTIPGGWARWVDEKRGVIRSIRERTNSPTLASAKARVFLGPDASAQRVFGPRVGVKLCGFQLGEHVDCSAHCIIATPVLLSSRASFLRRRLPPPPAKGIPHAVPKSVRKYICIFRGHEGQLVCSWASADCAAVVQQR
jgi:hypothetical protein